MVYEHYSFLFLCHDFLTILLIHHYILCIPLIIQLFIIYYPPLIYSFLSTHHSLSVIIIHYSLLPSLSVLSYHNHSIIYHILILINYMLFLFTYTKIYNYANLTTILLDHLNYSVKILNYSA